ncbi:MAG: hypothetical protein U9P14_06905 [Gemmatimonadota bacterium]|nr:hypothetical protein [Gemmatimonadota bacterium]
MHCKQIARQTRGKISEVELDGLVCDQAAVCRRKGICVLSQFSNPQLIGKEKGKEAREPALSGEPFPTHCEVLVFKKSLGFQWVRTLNFEDAVRAAENRPEDEDHPKLIRRVEFFQLPEWDVP